MNTKIVTLISIAGAAVVFTACQTFTGARVAGLKVNPTANDTNLPITVRPASGALGTIERLDPALDALLTKDAIIEKLAEGFDWSEGPVWMPEGHLLFSDVPLNTIFKWEPRSGVTI